MPVTAARKVNAQTPTSTPSGDFLCSAGPRDGGRCTNDDDCFASCSGFGACVLVQGVCDGGANFDGYPCDCPGGNCVAGACSGGVFDGFINVASGDCKVTITSAFSRPGKLELFCRGDNLARTGLKRFKKGDEVLFESTVIRGRTTKKSILQSLAKFDEPDNRSKFHPVKVD
jgi:hypothetical protein